MRREQLGDGLETPQGLRLIIGRQAAPQLVGGLHGGEGPGCIAQIVETFREGESQFTAIGGRQPVLRAGETAENAEHLARGRHFLQLDAEPDRPDSARIEPARPQKSGARRQVLAGLGQSDAVIEPDLILRGVQSDRPAVMQESGGGLVGLGDNRSKIGLEQSFPGIDQHRPAGRWHRIGKIVVRLGDHGEIAVGRAGLRRHSDRALEFEDRRRLIRPLHMTDGQNEMGGCVIGTQAQGAAEERDVPRGIGDMGH